MGYRTTTNAPRAKVTWTAAMGIGSRVAYSFFNQAIPAIQAELKWRGINTPTWGNYNRNVGNRVSHGLLKTICDAIKSIHVNDANASRRTNPQVTWKDYSIGNRVSQSLIDQIKSNLFNVQQVCGCNTVYIKTCTCNVVWRQNPNNAGCNYYCGINFHDPISISNCLTYICGYSESTYG